MIELHYTDIEPGWKLEQEADVLLWLNQIAERHKRGIELINYIFCSDEYVLYLNQKHLQHDYFTDILTFDYTDAPDLPLVVDIYISLERVQENARELKVNEVDEMHRVMVHGLLHCIGFNDHSDEEEQEMRKQEELALALRMF